MAKKQSTQHGDFWIGGILYAITALAFLPITLWLVHKTQQNAQILNSLLVLVFVLILLVLNDRHTLKLHYTLNAQAQWLLLASYLLMGVASISGISPLVLLAYSLAIGSFLYFLFGTPYRQIIISGTAAIIFFFAMIVFLPLFDWPLREIAGQLAATGLQSMGYEVQLGWVAAHQAPMLILIMGDVPFHVAAECNGFGIITSSLILAIILTFYQRPAWSRISLNLLLTLALGFLFNSLRIIAIVLLAPIVGDQYYMFMHEAIGLFSTYSCLLLIWFLLTRLPHARTLLPNQNS